MREQATKDAVIAALSRTRAGRAAWKAYINLRWTRPFVRRVESEIAALHAFGRGSEPGAIAVVYDNTVSPPTFGNFLDVVMLARLLAYRGGPVEFSIIDGGWGSRTDWDARGVNSTDQAEFLQSQIGLARSLLPEHIPVATHPVVPDPDQGSGTRQKFLVFDSCVRSGEIITAHAANLINALLVNSGLEVPEGFLLTGRAFPCPSVKRRIQRPYVAWHVRLGVWDLERNPSESVVESDFRQLRELFPRHSIMIFSTPAGVQQTLSTLSRANLLQSARSVGVDVYAQPSLDFIESIPWVLGADFYFQRLGGGLAMIPAYSDIPYLMIVGDRGYQIYGRGSRLVPWANPDQRCLVLPRGAEGISIRDALKAASQAT